MILLSNNLCLSLPMRLDHIETRSVIEVIVWCVCLDVVRTIANEIQELGAHVPVVLALHVKAELDVLSVGRQHCARRVKRMLNR